MAVLPCFILLNQWNNEGPMLQTTQKYILLKIFDCVHGIEINRKATGTKRMSGKKCIIVTNSCDVEYLMQLYKQPIKYGTAGIAVRTMIICIITLSSLRYGAC